MLPPQLFQALTQSLLQQLRVGNTGTGDLRALLVNAIVNFNEPPRTPVNIPLTSLTTPGGSAGGSITPGNGQGHITPADDDGTPLSRQSSTTSVSSASTVSSTHDWEDGR